MIVAEQATEAFTPHDLTRLTTHFSLRRDEVVTDALMIPLRMIMGQILVEHVIQRVFAQHHHMMQGFLLDRAHEPFAMGIEIGTPRRSDDRLHTARLQQGVEGLCELCVPVAEQIPLAEQEALKGVRQLSGALVHEGSRGMGRDPSDMHPPCGYLHHDKHIGGHEAAPRGDFHREEVGRGEDLPGELQKVRPAHPTLSSLQGGIHMMATQNIAHRNLVDAMPQIRQSALDPSVTPTGVFLGHACDELFDLLGDARSATLSSLLTPVKLLGNQSLVPAQERVRCGDGRHGHFNPLASARNLLWEARRASRAQLSTTAAD
jgi:hypothetical protein